MSAEWRLADFDVCKCGDYRYQHVNGMGTCRMPNDLTHGFKICAYFRLAHEATEIPKWVDRPKTRVVLPL